jgi:BirA family transcriptional regulator, biotin operon repressor / biotin---[acetyl-CoA-carboxylase] ligase
MKTRDLVFKELAAQSADTFLSGAEIASRCGISRQAVWKAVTILRAEGVQICAVTNCGYRLIDCNRPLSADAVNNLVPRQFHVQTTVYETIDSTNNEAKRRCAGAADSRTLDHTVIVAGQQTAGRGRLGRTFYSPPGTGLYLSIIYAPENGISSPAVLTSSAAVGVCRALRQVYGTDGRIKWVNDVFLHGKKICGILAEGITNFETGHIDYAVVGIGINILPGSFPPELASVATSVLESLDVPVKRNELAAAVITEVLGIYTAGEIGINAAMKEYRMRSLLTGRMVMICPVINQTEKNYRATVVDITDNAELVVKTEDGSVRILDSGEVSLHSVAVADTR